jgi:hypothetical protein
VLTIACQSVTRANASVAMAAIKENTIHEFPSFA